MEGYTYSHNKQENLTHLLYEYVESMFEDIGFFWGLDKCATINIVCGKLQTNEENGLIGQLH